MCISSLRPFISMTMAFDEEHLNEAYRALEKLLRELAPLSIAYSGGVDSTLLLKAAVDTVGDNAAAITVDSAVYPRIEIEEAVRLAASIGAEHHIIKLDHLSDSQFRENSPMRCYHCRKRLYAALIRKAEELGRPTLLDGANADDAGDYRPGMNAAREMGVRSPFFELGMTKALIRALSKKLGLPTAEKPSYACLASRIPYGEEITLSNLEMVEKSENLLRKLGMNQARVRWHRTVARIEVMPSEISRVCQADIRELLVEELKSFGFKYVTLDLEGYRTGSLNEALDL